MDAYDPATCVGVCGTRPPGLANYVELKTYRWGFGWAGGHLVGGKGQAVGGSGQGEGCLMWHLQV